MIGQDSEFRQAIEQICAGSDEAVWNFIETYGPHIQRVVRRRLHQSLRSKFDSIDFVQMVWASFFADRKRIAAMREPEELIRYLMTMARNKVIDESRRRMKYQKHNVCRERSLDVGQYAGSVRRHDTPSQIASVRERWAGWMKDQSERNRRIVEMRMDGVAYDAISQHFGLSERTVREVIERCRYFMESSGNATEEDVESLEARR
jgi:RNA polymerase sigma-70 factor (ECF subfamily)